MSVPLHSYHPHYVPVPDAPQASMIDWEKLPAEIQDALRKVREYESNGAAWPTLLDNGVRAWFRYEERAAASPRQEGQ